jgi:hypothetical protein
MAILPAFELPNRIQKLLEERQQHADAIIRIDLILGGVGAALKGAAPASPTVSAPAIKSVKRRRGKGHFPMSAEASVLAFVKQRKNPMTAEINQHLKDEGRSTNADNALNKLVKAKKLKRTPLEGQRGSRYLVV